MTRQVVTDSPARIVGSGGAGEDPPVRSGSGGLMPNTSAIAAAIRKGVLGVLVTFPVSPKEVELTFATNGESLRLKTLIALMLELATVGRAESRDALAHGYLGRTTLMSTNWPVTGTFYRHALRAAT